MLRICILSFLLHFTSSRVNKHLKISCGLEEVSKDSVAMRFYIQLENKGKECRVVCIPDRCCLEQGNEENCDVLQIFGGCLETVPEGESRTVRLAAPLLNPFERRGYCIVHIHSKVKGHRLYRDTLTIPFDTGKPAGVKPCPGFDQDPCNNCQPINCDIHYNDQKPYYSKRAKRCIETPPCSDDDKYDASKNKCVKSITEDDIRAIKSLNRKMRSSDYDFETTTNDYEYMTETTSEEYKPVVVPASMRILDYLRSPKLLIFVISVQCCLVIGLVYFIKKRCQFVKKETEVHSKFFNFKHVDSCTTPLLSHGTVTTCQFQSDSSLNIDRKIRFYKACQKDKTKASMSDDILSRCLKRRDWITKPKTSDIIAEQEKEDHGVQVYETEHISDRTTKSNHKTRSVIPVDSLPMQISSEQQVKCFEYEDQNFYSQYAPKTHSLTEKCAQACFSKDSIDDFMSERGMLKSISSSKTSKNNVDNVFSLLCHRLGPGSDPGCKSDDLELLHMSRASFSSSNEEFDLKKVKESRSSM